MKVGLSTWSLLGLDVYAAAKAIGDSGLEYIELWGEIPHAYPDWVDAKKLKDVLSSYSMTISMHAPFTDLNLATTFDPVKSAVEKALLSSLHLAESLGAKVATFHPGSVHNSALVSRSVDDSASMVRSLMKQFQGNVRINVENQTASHSKYHYPVASSEESIRSLLEKTQAGFTLDTGHAHASGVDSLKVIDFAGSRLSEVHLSDNEGETDDHLIPGKGSAELEGLLHRISSTDVLVCLEIDPYTYPPGPAVHAALETRKKLSSLSGKGP